MKKVRLSVVLTGMLISLLALSGCKRKDPEPENEQEEINYMELIFTPATGGNPVTFVFSDPDGPGGNPPSISAPPLRARSSYNLNITLAKIEGTKRQDKTAEILREADKHQFFFIITPSSLMTHRYSDADKNNRPLGLQNVVETQTSGNGKLRVVLRHDLNKAFPNLSSANFQQAGGETDIDVEFSLTVQ
ncbi:MAG: hypothetical protein RMJ44_00095 [Cytophagales bacterium]|nr:hypothetical protein [Bernardetiaceae bacterium]MDW8209460.1 hypothetical protein [Cytophagales bacterium]